jgi:hypothetical protein
MIPTARRTPSSEAPRETDRDDLEAGQKVKPVHPISSATLLSTTTITKAGRNEVKISNQF